MPKLRATGVAMCFCVMVRASWPKQCDDVDVVPVVKVPCCAVTVGHAHLSLQVYIAGSVDRPKFGVRFAA